MNILIGKVTNVDMQKGSVRVVFPSKNNQVSDWLPLLTCCIGNINVGDTVCVMFTNTGLGLCMGTFFNDSITPKQPINISREIISNENITTTKNIKATNITGNVTGGV